jgi:hypothetical protein
MAAELLLGLEHDQVGLSLVSTSASCGHAFQLAERRGYPFGFSIRFVLGRAWWWWSFGGIMASSMPLGGSWRGLSKMVACPRSMEYAICLHHLGSQPSRDCMSGDPMHPIMLQNRGGTLSCDATRRAVGIHRHGQTGKQRQERGNPEARKGAGSPALSSKSIPSCSVFFLNGYGGAVPFP